jgi:hypothetical protein
VNELWISADDTPPEYDTADGISPLHVLLIEGLKAQVKLSVNLECLPSEAWEVRQGVSGKYKRVRFQLGLSFGPGGIEWRFLYKGKVIGSVQCEYS